MARDSRSDDRLAAILAELDESRRSAWLPDEDDLVDRPDRWRRFRRRERPAEHSLDSLADVEDDGLDALSRAERRQRGIAGRDLRPHEPLLRSPLGSTAVEAHPARAAVMGAFLVVAVVAVVLMVRVWSTTNDNQPRPLAAGTAVAGPGPTEPAASTRAPASAAPTGVAAPAVGTSSIAGPLTVHVVGQVKHPGVVRLSPGARVQDALDAAGGATATADLSAINLARAVSDGEQVHVPKPGEAVTEPPAAPVAPSAAAGAAPPGSGPTGPVNVNTADEATLDTLPGVGPVLASRIVQWRATNGRFTTVDDLGEVSGIGDKLLEQLRPLVTV